jgi:predicted DNA-binding transcriptional regulator YafY
MERLTRILSMLAAAEATTMAADDLLAEIPYGGTNLLNQRDQLRRDISHLESLGWQIANVAGEGEMSRYRLTAVDNRLRVEFTPAQRAELLRAASAASLVELVDDLADEAVAPQDGLAVLAEREGKALAAVQRAVAGHCLVRFTYRDKPRVAHPHALHARTGEWYLVANEDGANEAKTFVVSRMSEVRIDEPGTASAPEHVARPELDPVSWLVDPPVDVTVVTTGEHRAHVENLLGPASSVSVEGEQVVLVIPVTHRQAFRRRVYELGSRVLVTGPGKMRAEIRAELLAVLDGQAG